MAARKLKFKPKPSVSGSTRRVRENDDLPELEQKEPSTISIKDTPTENLKKEQLEVFIKKDTENSDCVALKKLKTENSVCNIFADGLVVHLPNQIVSVDSSSKVNHHKDLSVSISPEATIDETPSNITSQEHKSPVTNEELNKFNNIGVNLVGETKDNEILREVTTVPDESPVKDSCVKSSNKSDSSKVFSRFGRSRCKPVLNKPGVRKKSDVTLDSSSNTDNVRTDSVTKLVATDLNKAKAIVAEITESFSLLEADEPNPLVIQYCENECQKLVVSNDILTDKVETLGLDDQKNKSSVFTNNSSSSCLLTQPGVKTELNNSTKNGVVEINHNHICHSEKIEQLNENSSDSLNTNITPSLVTNKVPISPLKPTPKILVPKPCPRISDIVPRRASFQGSDSEDEARRKKPCIKHDFANSSTKDTNEKNIKKNKRKRSQGSTYSKMGQETLEKFTQRFGSTVEPDKTKLKMIDLIFYNPKNNPMTINAQQTTSATKKEENLQVSETVQEALEEQEVDDMESAAIPVPQLKVGPDGQIMLDPKSLVIETTGMEKNRAKLENSKVIQETGITRYSTYSKRRNQRTDWTHQETLQFYRALNTIGSDFALMTKLFPKRTRHELKLKFKREERTNLHLIDKAMTAPADFDFNYLEEELKRENEETDRKILQKQLDKENKKKERALRKEGKLKKVKPKETKGLYLKDSAFKDFNEPEIDAIKKMTKKSISKRKRTRRKDKGQLDSDLEEELLIDLDSNSPDEFEEGLSIMKIVKETCSGRIPKPSSKFEEYEEMNETLKKKMEEESELEEDVYTPNGPGAHMLFGSPEQTPSQEPDGHWTIEINSLPTIEETVLLESVEEVSELSELGSFGQNDTALDLSMPVRSSLQTELLHESQASGSLLNRHIISQSIKIIDQLTSNVEDDSMCADGEVIKSDVSEEENMKIPLPSFESVSRSRPSVVYPMQGPFIPVEGSSSSGTLESNKEPGIVLDNYFNERADCILGE